MLAFATCLPATGVDNIPSYSLQVSWSLISSPLASIHVKRFHLLSPTLSSVSVARSDLFTKVEIRTVLTTISQSQFYQFVANAWRNMSWSISPNILKLVTSSCVAAKLVQVTHQVAQHSLTMYREIGIVHHHPSRAHGLMHVLAAH